MAVAYKFESTDSPASSWTVTIAYYIITCAILLAFFLVFYPGTYANFVPAEDEPGFYAGALKMNAYHWISSGYTNYFDVYPEWFAPYTSYIRPATSAFAWLLHLGFGNKFAYYIYTYYAFILLAAVYLHKCLTDMGVKGPWILFAAVIWPLSPPVISMGLWNFPFIFDVAVALTVIIAFRAVLYERYIVAFLALLLSLSTKETAAFAPVAAAATVLIVHRFNLRSWGIAALMLLPAVIWAGVRQFYLGQFSGGTYARIGLESVFHAIGVWPVGLSPAFSTLKHFSLSSAWLGNPQNWIDLASAGVNALVWVAVIAIFIKYLIPLIWRYISGDTEPSQADKWLLASIIWLGGAFAYLLLNNLYGRYGGCFILFLILTLVTVAYRDRDALVGRLSQAALIALTLLYIPAGIVDVRALSQQASTAQKMHTALDRALTGIEGPGRKVYVVNAPRGFSSPSYIARLLDSPHELIFLNQFNGCTAAPDFSGVPENTPKGLHVVLPKCSELVFHAVTNPDFATGTVDVVERKGVGTYIFGSQKAEKFTIVPGYTLDGHEFYFQGVPAGADVIYYDWSKERFEHLNLAQG
jgi:hypothetical protein